MRLVRISLFPLVLTLCFSLPSTSLAGNTFSSSAQQETEEQESSDLSESEPIQSPNLTEADGFDSTVHKERYRRHKANAKRRAVTQPGHPHNL
jgi:hypothetical protein